MVLSAALNDIIKLTLKAFNDDNAEAASIVEPFEELIDDLISETKRRHVKRIQKGICIYQQGYVYNDILTNIERIADHCSNLAIAVIERKDNTFEAHEALKRLKTSDNESFKAAYNEFAAHYTLD